jgi:serine/threonine protein phosphatase PrpC
MYRGNQGPAQGAAVAPARAHYQLQGPFMDVEFSQLSDIGRVRQGNEDYLGFAKPETPEQIRTRGWLFAVADGVGGHDLGEVASRTAVESLIAGFRSTQGSESHSQLLTRLVRDANARVVDAGHAANVGGTSMATTLVACALRYDRATVAHVGDSRCYLIRGVEARLLTRDHTVASEHVRLGLLSADEAAASENRHLLSRSLGAELFVNVDVDEHQVLPSDILLLCSDGLHGSVGASEMAAVAGHATDLKNAAQRLVDIANQRDGSDNVTLQLIRVRSVERVGMYRGRPYRLP